MRKQNTKTTVPLDVVPERRTKRFPRRFRPVDHFCELRFRHLSSPTGREGEISRPLDHMRQIPFKKEKKCSKRTRNRQMREKLIIKYPEKKPKIFPPADS